MFWKETRQNKEKKGKFINLALKTSTVTEDVQDGDVSQLLMG